MNAERAERLRQLHHADGMLVLPNAWDVASARLFERLGFPAVATSSAAVARSIGYEDGELTPVSAMLEAVGRIAEAVSVPVTADLEGGYGLEPETLVDGLLDAGAVGLNLEDTDHRGDGGLVELSTQAERLAAVKEAGRGAGVDLVLNARVDLPGSELEEAIARGRAYRDAGADCIYPIKLSAEDDIAAFVERVGGPINVLAWPEAPGPARLAELGVARMTWGSGLAHVALRAVEELLAPLAPSTG